MLSLFQKIHHIPKQKKYCTYFFFQQLFLNSEYNVFLHHENLFCKINSMIDHTIVEPVIIRKQSIELFIQ